MSTTDGSSPYSITIDGPAGAGKSTIARRVAQELGWLYIDTGAMYRCVALMSQIEQEEPLKIARCLKIELGTQVVCNGQNVTQAIRTPEISSRASEIATDPLLREILVKKQQEMAASQACVIEGRDAGSHVLPAASLKVFLTASLEERALRRRTTGRHQEILEALTVRDQRDTQRLASPLQKTSDQVEIDTTHLTIDEVVSHILRLAPQASRENA